MGVDEKIANVKKTDWVVRGMPETHVKAVVEQAKISAKIEKCRLDRAMTRHEFAVYMGVSQEMVSKWESANYKFTEKTIGEICEKLRVGMKFN